MGQKVNLLNQVNFHVTLYSSEFPSSEFSPLVYFHEIFSALIFFCRVCPNLVDVFLSKKKERKNKGMVRVTSKIEELVDPALNYQNVAEKTSEVHSWMDLDYLLSTLSISKENVSSQDPPKVQRNNIPVVIEILSSSDDE